MNMRYYYIEKFFVCQSILVTTEKRILVTTEKRIGYYRKKNWLLQKKELVTTEKRIWLLQKKE